MHHKPIAPAEPAALPFPGLRRIERLHHKPIEDVRHLLEEHPTLRRALHEQDTRKPTGPAVLPSWLWDVSQRTAATLLRWRVEPGAALAALLAPLLEHGLASAQTLGECHGQEAVALAQRLIDWHQQGVLSARGMSNPSPAQYSVQLRRLYRQVYLDLPHFAFILLLLADHNVRLWHDVLGSPRLAVETQAVFIPLAETLGMWRLRRWWVERSMALQEGSIPHDAKDTPEAPDTPDTQEKTRQKRDVTAYKEIHRRLVAQRKGKQELFRTLRDALITQCKESLPPGAPNAARLPIVRRIKTYSGITLRRSREGKAKDELINRLRVRVLCPSILECYRVLGVIHRLGKPAALRSLGSFEDHIAAPKSNGYQALYTTIMYKPSTSVHPEVLVEFRILTPPMHKRNERGVLVLLQPNRVHPTAAQPWWSAEALATLSHRLCRYAEHAPYSTIQPFLAHHDLGTTSQPLYVFTAHGDLFLLEQGSTPLDLAYAIHTELGHHAAHVAVNGQWVPHHYPLYNGDLVRIEADPHWPGPNLAWLSCVTTTLAQDRLRQGLARRAEAVHPQRAAIENCVLAMTRAYKREHHYDMVFTTARLDALLLRLARQRQLPDLEAVYMAVAQKRFSARELARALIAQTLAATLVVTVNDQPTPYPLNHIQLCEVCQPGPGDAIFGDEQRTATGPSLIVHRRPARPCPTAGQAKVLRWAKQRKARSTIIVVWDGQAPALVAALAVTVNGQFTPYPLDHIRLCEVCQPGPGDAIFGDEQRTAKGPTLIVHRQAPVTEAAAGPHGQRCWRPDHTQGEHGQLLYWAEPETIIVVWDGQAPALVAALAVTVNGQFTPYPLDHIRLCEVCQPGPGDAIFGDERRTATGPTLIVHRQRRQPRCPWPTEGQRPALVVRWSELHEAHQPITLAQDLGGEARAEGVQRESTQPLTAAVEIGAKDRHQLLAEVLAVVYAQGSLHKVEAVSYSDGMADISLEMSVDTWATLAEIRGHLRNIATVHQVRVFPAWSHPLPRSRAGERYANPYTPLQVYGRTMFYDREALLDRLLTWLEDGARHWVLLHGQRRVGKTSVVQHLRHEILRHRPLAIPVFVDLHNLSEFGTAHIAYYVVQAIYSQLHLADAAPPDQQAPMLWLNRALEAAVHHLKGHRLLVMLDEFDVLLEKAQAQQLDCQLFTTLRAVMNARPELAWLLIVRDSSLYEPMSVRLAGALFQQAIRMPVEHFERDWAYKLIREPAERAGVGYESDGLIAQIGEATAGNPYLINILCWILVDRLQVHRRTIITAEDLEEAKARVLHDGTQWFFHLYDRLSPRHKRVAEAVAIVCQPGEWGDVIDLRQEVKRRGLALALPRLHRILQELAWQGVVAIRQEGATTQVRIPIPLLQAWVQGWWT